MNTFTLGLIVLLYLLSLAYLGWLGYRKTNSTSDYLIGGREMNPIVMALSYGATFISASAIVGFGGVAAAFGMGIQWLCMLNMFVGVIIAFIFFAFQVIFAGYSFLSSQGDAAKLKAARDRLTQGILGITIVVIAFGVTAFISSLLGLGNIFDLQSFFNSTQ